MGAIAASSIISHWDQLVDGMQQSSAETDARYAADSLSRGLPRRSLSRVTHLGWATRCNQAASVRRSGVNGKSRENRVAAERGRDQLRILSR